VAAAAAVVAVACLLVAGSIAVDRELQQQVVRQLRGQGASHAAADVDELLLSTGELDTNVSDDAELDSYTDDADAAAAAAAAAGQESVDATDASAAADVGLGAAALLRLSPAKLDEVQLLVRESFQMVMSRELLSVARQRA
jgi:hypothetical protein